MKPRLVFMGSAPLGLPILEALYTHPYHMVGVYTRPPQPKGRGHAVQKTPIHLLAQHQGTPVFTPLTFRNNPEAVAELMTLQPDLILVVAYGLILPQSVLTIAPHGCLNIHVSLLPKWRGAAPIQRALMAGDQMTGITFMKMDEGLDTGPILAQYSYPILPTTTSAHIHDDLGQLAAHKIHDVLTTYLAGKLTPRPQPDVGVFLAPKLTKAEGELRWTQPAAVLERLVRALNPWPGAWFTHGDVMLRVWGAQLVAGMGPPGTVLDHQLTIACGHHALRLTHLQRPGGKVLAAPDFLRGYPIDAGTVLHATL